MHLQDAEEPVHRNNNTSCIQRIKTLIKTHKCSDPKEHQKDINVLNISQAQFAYNVVDFLTSTHTRSLHG